MIANKGINSIVDPLNYFKSTDIRSSDKFKKKIQESSVNDKFHLINTMLSVYNVNERQKVYLLIDESYESFYKLVRDKIPAIIEELGRKCHIRHANEKE